MLFTPWRDLWTIPTLRPVQNKQCLLSKTDSFVFRVPKIQQHPQGPMRPHPRVPSHSHVPSHPCVLPALPCPFSSSMSIHHPVFFTPPCLLHTSMLPSYLHASSHPQHPLTPSVSPHTPCPLIPCPLIPGSSAPLCPVTFHCLLTIPCPLIPRIPSHPICPSHSMSPQTPLPPQTPLSPHTPCPFTPRVPLHPIDPSRPIDPSHSRVPSHPIDPSHPVSPHTPCPLTPVTPAASLSLSPRAAPAASSRRCPRPGPR